MAINLRPHTFKQPRITLGYLLAISMLLVACGGGTTATNGRTAANTTTPVPSSTPVPTVRPVPTATPIPTPITSGNYTIPASHPRIFLSSTRLAELQSRYAGNGAAITRFKQVVDSAVNGGNVYGFEAWNAALMSKVSGNTSYCSWAVQHVDTLVAAEETLINANQRATVAGDSYLEVGDVIGDLAMVYDWCYAQTTTQQRQRWITYANQAVWNVWNYTQARWGNTIYPWSGWSIDNPVNNYYYSFLKATMLLGLATTNENPQAADWIRMFRETKIRDQLVPVFQRDLAGGGSREGTGYGTAMRSLFWLYDVWASSTGERLADLSGHAKASGPYLIHSVVPTLDRLAPIGDHARDQTAMLFDYHRHYALGLAKLYPTDAVGRTLVDFTNQCSVPQMTQQFQRWIDFVYDPAAIAPKPIADLYPVYYGQGTGHVFMRSDWTRNATWVHFTAGPYTESHAHRDQGQLLLFKREWLAFDENMLSASGIRQEEDWHNLVRLSRNGSMLRQREGSGPAQLYGLNDNVDFTWAAGNLAPAYNAADGVQTLDREVLFIKPNVVVVFDRFAGQAGISADWLLNSPISPTQSGNTVTFAGGQTTMVAHRVHPATATTTISSWRSLDAEATAGYRLAWTSATGPYLVVLSLDGAVTNAIAADTTGIHGTTITLNDGRTLTARFNDTQRGGTVEIRAANGSITRQSTLTPSVMNLPVFQTP